MSHYLQLFLKKIFQTPDANNETQTRLLLTETFFKELIGDFYLRIIDTNAFDNFENLSIEWIRNTLKRDNINAKTFLESIQDHQISFSSLIGFFYQHGIGCNIDKDKALEMYLSAIEQDKEDQTVNSI